MKRHAVLPLGSFEAPEVFHRAGQFEVPAHLARSLGGGSISLPNASLCADFLVLPSREIIGVCVGVSGDDLPIVRSLFGKAHSGRVAIKEPNASMPLRYSAYPTWNWLEVTWKNSSDANLVEAQSNQVLWFVGSDSAGHLIAMVLEDLDYIEAETEGVFALGQTTPYSPSSTPRG